MLKAGEIHERIGYSYFRAATQADNVEEFKKRMQMSVESYEKAGELLDKVEAARGLYSRAMARYSNSWFVQNPSQKRELLGDRSIVCVRLSFFFTHTHSVRVCVVYG